MSIKTDWKSVSSYNIPLKDCNVPYDITEVFKKHKTKKYVYVITHNNLIIKVGMSAARQKTLGERSYRQVGHSKSWDKPLTGSSGSDWYHVEDIVRSKHGYEMHKDNIVITVYDFTDYPFVSINQEAEILRAESELIQQYTNIMGKKPIGNITNDETIFNKGLILQETYDKLFDEVNG